MTGWALVAVAGWLVAAALVVAHRRRCELVARACHELAAPLGAAGLALHAAQREAACGTARLAAVELELARARRALDDLHAARSLRGAPDTVGVVDVGVLLARQALVWQVAARERGRELRVAVASGLMVRADGVRLAQAVGNLLANALEHGHGRVELRAAGDAGRVRIEVHDEGPGLADPARALARRRRGGRGARGRGLAIAAAIATRHGGTLAARGPALTLDLPADRAALERADAGAAAAERARWASAAAGGAPA